jgi:biopolymer transport protein ExbB
MHANFFTFILGGFQSAGGWVMWIILAVGFIILGFAIERFWYLFVKCGMNSAPFMSQISVCLKAGDFDKAIKLAFSINTPLAKVVRVILQNRGKGVKYIQKIVDEVFLTEVPKISANINLLNMLANLATLIGLLGTVYGLLETFNAIANIPAAQRAQALAAGIAIAMSATLMGLSVAAPTILMHGFINRKAEGLVVELDEKSAKLINIIEE